MDENVNFWSLLSKYVFIQTTSPQAEYDTRSIFMGSKIGLNLELSFS